MLDIVFCSVPFSNLNNIYSAPAILKGVSISNGYTAQTVDFGLDLFNQCNRDPDYFNEVQIYFIKSVDNHFIHYDKIDKFYDHCINFFKNNPSEYIGLSVLSVFSQKAIFELCYRIKKEGITSKIVVGGRGLKVSAFSSISDNHTLTDLEKMLSFAEILKKRNLVECTILGDGEDAIIDILSKKTTNETADNLSDTFKSPIPNYDDYKLDQYLTNNKLVLPVIGSKGCVRDCDFCDVKFQFGRYRYRSGKDIVSELISLSAKHNVFKFQFTDNLINGGYKPFVEFLELMAEYNKNHPNNTIKWTGQYICRPEEQIPAGLHTLIKSAGGEGLTIGAESGSNRVLEAMNKKTSVESLYHELEEFRKADVTVNLLTFVGHWSEQWDDFVDHCRMFINLAKYVRSGTISSVTIGYPMAFLDGTPSMNLKETNTVILSNFEKEFVWFCKTNPRNTFKERIYRRLIIQKICTMFNMPVIYEAESILVLNAIIKNHGIKINEFYSNVS